MATIYSPNPDFTGVRRGVEFADGVGRSDDPATVESFRRRGWVVEDGAPSAPSKAAPKSEWVKYAVSQGADREEAESVTKADLFEVYG